MKPAPVRYARPTSVAEVVELLAAHCAAARLLARGQSRLGECLFEAIRYDPAGVPLSQGYMDYILPTAPTVPRFILRHIETPSPTNPLGMKGAGGAGCSGALAAIANAVADALGPRVPVPNGAGPLTPECMLEILYPVRSEEASL